MTADPAAAPARRPWDDAPLDMLGYADWSDVEAAIDGVTDDVLAEHGLPTLAEHRAVCRDVDCWICGEDAAPKGTS